MKSIKGKVLLLGIIGFIILLVAQILLYEERAILDTAHSVFFISNEMSFDATQKRYAIALNQVLPVAYTYIGSSIKGVITAYYVNDFLWYLGFFLVFLFGFKKPAAALALVVGYFTILGPAYFIITYSAPISWPLLIMLSLILTGQILQDQKKLRWLVALVCIFFMAFSNPINSVTTLLFLAYFLAQAIEQKKPKAEVIASIVFFFGVCLYQKHKPRPLRCWQGIRY